ncbi:MAG: mismatch repair protein MutS2 [Synergistaceae bacterium]|nr:mismatch repair protein MutS2 [Synergistaceae bacterium]
MEVREDILRILEIPKILAEFASCVRGELGLSAIGRLRPRGDGKSLEERVALFKSYMSCRDTFGEWPWNSSGCISGLTAEARKSGLLTGEELASVARFLSLAKMTREHLVKHRDAYPLFDSLSRQIRDFSEESDALGVLDDKGNLYDSASPKLAEIRHDLETLRRQIRRSAQNILDNPSLAHMLQERVTAFRNGHFVFLVRQEFVNRFPGTVVDRSGSGSSVYMEPSALVPLNNRLALRVRDEKEEERAILRRLTKVILARERPLSECENVLSDLDLFYGAAEVMAKKRWKLPQYAEKTMFVLQEARHPLLGDAAVPVTIRCGDRFRSLVITGPNTGGKTVVLKTAGVCVYLAWCGLPIPAGEDSVVGNIGSIFADIGDEQSIEQNLSTFSAHVKNIISILEQADRTSLVLLDELGAGTDPQEGAALGIAILDTLTREKGLTLATTHHNPVKQYALTAPGVETASMEFDIESLSPTYRMLLGVPGKSNALLIAGRYGLPQKVLEKARKVLSEREAPVEDLIGELNERKAWLDRAEGEIAALRKSLLEEKKKYDDKMREIESRRDRILSEAERKAASILEKAEESSRKLLKQLEDSAKSAVHRQIRDTSEKVRSERKHLEQNQEKRLLRSGAADDGEFSPSVGTAAQVAGTEIVGTIESIRGNRALLRAGVMKMEVDVKKLLPTKKKPKGAVTPPESFSISPDRVPPSIMVRGMNVDEALPVVERYLDQAMRMGYDQVTVIHGRGEGILRREVHALCSSLKYVASYRLGGPSEGGFGVTVVEFRK